ncbi:hypothetical protein HUK65_05055 [Rhodobacteraceae bacterium 2376]|uniref:Uncharacterized protein n=1 Tax=Rhabdonatronobacter sediminivivens TaxID=2743469 RepID=A0A7Z0HXZ3_9RHOB|nr:hypothetical protein [Rhabdonatronobacter sediminivivens]NYS24354.1 hypothetical protein [Rhabdonatronobacter sediminivivens]
MSAPSGTNNLRTLASVVSLDGWIGEFEDNNHATVHVDVVFQEASFGADPADKVSFRIRLKRAQILLNVPENEPLTIRRESIARTVVSDCTEIETTRETEASAKAAASVAAKVNQGLSLGADANAETRAALRTQSSTRRSVGRFLVQHFKEQERYGWTISSSDGQPMDGAPWDAGAEPRLTVKRAQERNSEGNKPSMKIVIRCRREDIEILDLEPKHPAITEKLRMSAHRARHIAAAEQVIKRAIERKGFLTAPDLSNKDSVVMVADMVVMEQD